MARPKEFDVDKALTAAMNVFWECGYEATSLEDLTTRMGIARPSLYGTFGDKRSLFMAALKKYQDWRLDLLRTKISECESAKEGITRFFKFVVEESCNAKISKGCLVANTAVELFPRDSEIAQLLEQHTQQMEELFEQALERGKSQGELAAHLDSQAVAKFLRNTLVGLAVTAKSSASKERLEQILAVSLSVLEK